MARATLNKNQKDKMSTKKASKAKTVASKPVAVNESGIPLVLLTLQQLLQTITAEQVKAADIRGLSYGTDGSNATMFLGNGATISIRRRLEGLRVKAYLPDVGGAGASVVYPLETALADVVALATKLTKETPAKAKVDEAAAEKEANAIEGSEE